MTKCIKCGGEIPENAEFCPNCHSVADWSRADVKKINQETTTVYEYQNAFSEVKEPQKDRLKLFWIIGIIVIVFTVGYYFLDKYVLDDNSSVASPEQEVAIQLVQNSHLLESKRTTSVVLNAWAQDDESVARVIGWQAREIDDTGVYFVTYKYDDDMLDGNGTEYFFFEADTNTDKVSKSDDALVAKYRGLGFME